jgi:RNA polymerase sigma-70 factor (ECF subfamily)
MPVEIAQRVVRLAQRGDEAARAQVAESCRPLFMRVLAQRGCLDDAREEVAQEALLILLRQLPDFGFRARFETWALAILLNVLRRHRENEANRGRRQALEADLRSEDDPDAFERIGGSDPSDDPARAALQAALRQALADCLKPIPLDMREVWFRHRFHGQQHNEIAEALGISINTVGTRIFRADRKLRDCLESKGFTAETVGAGS